MSSEKRVTGKQAIEAFEMIAHKMESAGPRHFESLRTYIEQHEKDDLKEVRKRARFRLMNSAVEWAHRGTLASEKDLRDRVARWLEVE